MVFGRRVKDRQAPSRPTLGLVRALCVTSVATLTMGMTGCSLDSLNSETTELDGLGAARIIPKADRVGAPDISGTTLDGKSIQLSDYSGSVIVVNVWGSWCAPCRAEAPVLRQVARETKELGVQFLGLNTRDQQAAARAFEDQFNITYPSLIDTSGELQVAFNDSLPPNAIPSTLIIDRDFRVAGRIVGPATYNQLSDMVREIARR